MSASIADTLRAHLEAVSEDVANYWNFDDSLASRLKPAQVAEVSRYLYRVVVKRWPGGTMQKYSANRGDMGSGTGMNISYLTAGFIDTTLNFEITKEQMDTMEKDSQSRVKILSDTVADAFNVMSAHDNIFLFGTGNGQLTNEPSAQGSATFTYASATDPIRTNQILLGMMVDVWDTGLSTKRAGGPYKIIGINYNTELVTLHAAVTGVAATDKLTVAGLDAYGPSTLASFSSGWPGTPPNTTAAGLGGDSFMHGLRYVNDATAANYYLGQQKSGFTELLPSTFDANGVSLTFDMIETVKNDIIRRRGPSVLNGLMGVMHMRQKQKLQEIGMSIVRTMGGPEGVKLSDLQPSSNFADTFFVADLPHFVSPTQSRDRIDYFNPSNWGRVQSQEPAFYRLPDGGMFFPLRSSSTANLLAGFEFKITRKFDWVCHDPGAGGFIEDLAFA